MNQIGGTYEVREGALMSGGDKCITIENCRVTIEPLDQPIRLHICPTRHKGYWERTVDRFCKAWLVGFILYFIYIVVHAFTSGAVARLVQQ